MHELFPGGWFHSQGLSRRIPGFTVAGRARICLNVHLSGEQGQSRAATESQHALRSVTTDNASTTKRNLAKQPGKGEARDNFSTSLVAHDTCIDVQRSRCAK
jgi:hypothetical protein